MEEIIKSLGKFKNLEDICLQNFRSDKNFIKDTAKNLKPASELGISTAWIENDFNRKEADIFREYINFTGSDIKSILSNMLNFEKR